MKNVLLAEAPIPEHLSDAAKTKLIAQYQSAETDANRVTNMPVMVYWAYENTANLKVSHYLCHYHFYQALTSKTTFVFNKFTTQCTPSAERMTEFLISEDSPYSSLFKYPGISILRSAKGKALGIIFEDFNKLPIRLAFNFIIASRHISAWAMHHMWAHLVDSGVGKREAMILSTFFTFNSQDITLESTRDDRHTAKMSRSDLGIMNPVPGDQAFNIYGNGNRFSSRMFIQQKPNPKYLTQTLEENYAPNPCNIIWDNDAKKESPMKATTTNRDNIILQQLRDSFRKNESVDKELVTKLNTALRKGTAICSDWDIDHERESEDYYDDGYDNDEDHF